jgi:ankyrin repeat protein
VASSEVVWLLRERGARPGVGDIRGRTPMHEAAWSGIDAGAKIRILWTAGASAKVADRDGVTPLMCAAMRADEDTMALLLKLGASEGARDRRGWSAANYVEAARREAPESPQ